MKAEQKYDVTLPDYFAWPVNMAAAGQIQDWGHKYLRAGEIYGKTRGGKALIFILDTAGEFVHPDLVTNSLNRYGANFSDSPSLIDVHGHGTHCAGISAAADNFVGVIGIAPDARLVPIKVLNDQGRTLWGQLEAGIRYVADLQMEPEHQNLPRIISMSLGGPTGSKSLEAAIDYALDKGCFVVAAAGNSYQEGKDTVNYPGAYRQVITVASIGKTELPSSFSSAGQAVDLAAPGESVYSTHKNGSYVYLSGTSMATPAVAGVCANILSLFPEIKSQAQLEQFLKEHAKDLFGAGPDHRTGAGAPILPEYADEIPSEPDPEEPGEPAPDPEPEEPTREKRAVLAPLAAGGTVWWKTRNEQTLRPLSIVNVDIELTTDKFTPAAIDELTELARKYFTNRGYILSDGKDFQDAVYYVGLFLKLIVGEHLDIQISQITGIDEGNRMVKIEGSAYTKKVRKLEKRLANTFMVPQSIVNDYRESMTTRFNEMLSTTKS